MPSKLNIETLRLRGLAHGYVLKSTEYLGTRVKYEWICPVEHDASARLDAVESGNGCFDCGNIVRKEKLKSPLSFLLDLCLEKGFQCLAPSLYINCKQWMYFICPEGHLCLSNFNQIQRDAGCGYCDRHVNIDKLRLFAISMGGTCESSAYNNIYENINWKCRLDHRWEANCRRVMHRKQWCPTCAKKYNKWEDSVYAKLLTYLSHLEQKQKGLLKSKEMHLDILDRKSKRAVELDGDYWHLLGDGPERDLRKNRECQDAGIELLRIKYSDYMKNPEFYFNKILDFLKAA